VCPKPEPGSREHHTRPEQEQFGNPDNPHPNHDKYEHHSADRWPRSQPQADKSGEHERGCEPTPGCCAGTPAGKPERCGGSNNK
jgi:hypothetical protein